ncbi:12541_t:CDS:2 [Entrophospora sp. SA101]|nr:12541_t:CDS:2 [Entrophospora sp. SA101]
MVSYKFFSIAIIVAFLATAAQSAPSNNNVNCQFAAKFSPSSSENAKLYIVLLKTSTSASSSSKKNAAFKHFEMLKKCLGRKIQKVNASNFSARLDDKQMIYDFSVDSEVVGYNGYFTPEDAKKIAKLDEVSVVEQEQEIKANYALPSGNNGRMFKRAVVNNPLFNLDRIDQANFLLDKKYIFPDTAGQGVNVYVIDTGINVEHSDFGGRAKHSASFCEGCGDKDDNGHGTHVAGIIGGKTFGVAKKCNLLAVKVLAADGSGTNTDFVNGMLHVLSQHKKSSNKNTVINMSIGGGFSQAINDVVEKLTKAGIHIVVAAGKESSGACEVSPASAPSAITVGATEDTSDQIADFSNSGKCVDIFAPGSNIKSATFDDNNGSVAFSGTSQATPHVSGTIALIIAKEGNASPSSMASKLISLSTKDVVDGLDDSTPNRFLRKINTLRDERDAAIASSEEVKNENKKVQDELTAKERENHSLTKKVAQLESDLDEALKNLKEITEK